MPETSSWSEMTFGDLGQIFDGPHATPTRIDEGPYFLNIASLDNGRLDLSKSDHVAPDDFARWTRRITPRGGDLLFSYETRLGEAALMPEGVDACLGRRMALLRPRLDIVDPRFLLYLYLSPQTQRTIETHTIHGATVDRIPLKTMASWPVAVPALDEQRAIAEVLGALDDKIAANSRLVNVSDQLATALMRSEIRASDGTVALAEVADVTMGSSPPGTSYNEERIGTVFYQGVRDFGIRFPTNRVWTTAPVRMAAAGDVLVSVRAPVGRVNLAAEETCVGRGLAGVRSRTSTPYVLFHALRGASRAWAPYESEGTVFGSINRRQLESLELPRLTEEVAELLEARLRTLELRTASALEENATLAATRDALLPGLMSGKLRVKDAERVAESLT